MITLFAFCLAVPSLWETGRWATRLLERRRMFSMAEARAKELRRPLLVIGDPDGGWTKDTHGYGDVCLDMTGCPQAPVGVRCTLGKDTIPLADNSHVVFVCYTIELVPDIVKAYREVMRVSGGEKNAFILALDKKRELAAFSYPGVEWLIDTNGVGQVTGATKFYRRVPLKRRFR